VHTWDRPPAIPSRPPPMQPTRLLLVAAMLAAGCGAADRPHDEEFADEPQAGPFESGAQWVGQWGGSWGYKEEGDSFSVDALLEVADDGSYILAFVMHHYYEYKIAGRALFQGDAMILLPPDEGDTDLFDPFGQGAPCRLMLAGGNAWGLAPCMGWNVMDRTEDPLPMRRIAG
jgi:hypothetical protein